MYACVSVYMHTYFLVCIIEASMLAGQLSESSLEIFQLEKEMTVQYEQQQDLQESDVNQGGKRKETEKGAEALFKFRSDTEQSGIGCVH